MLGFRAGWVPGRDASMGEIRVFGGATVEEVFASGEC
jgi:hypothetical protein